MSATVEVPLSLVIPELGPFLGRLVAPPVVDGGRRHWILLEDIRYDLVTAVFARSGEAREWGAADDPDLTVSTLGRAAWIPPWEQALSAVNARAAAAINARLDGAAVEVRMPPRLRRRLPLGPDEIHALRGRLDAGSAPFREAVDRLEETGHAARAAHGKGPAGQAWADALATTARRLESAWLALEEALATEWVRWERDVQEVRAWRRPLWPLAVVSVLVFAAAIYTGLLLGGLVPVPSMLHGPVEWIWTRWS